MKDLLNFIKASPTAFHAAYNAECELEKNGFIKLSENSKWGFEKRWQVLFY